MTTGPSREESTTTIKRLMWWAVHAPENDRQRFHIASNVRACDLPPVEVIRAKCIFERPPNPATDAELDEADVPGDEATSADAAPVAAPAPAPAVGSSVAVAIARSDSDTDSDSSDSSSDSSESD